MLISECISQITGSSYVRIGHPFKHNKSTIRCKQNQVGQYFQEEELTYLPEGALGLQLTGGSHCSCQFSFSMGFLSIDLYAQIFCFPISFTELSLFLRIMSVFPGL